MTKSKSKAKRGYAQAYVKHVEAMTGDGLVVRLAKACVRSEVPISEIAKRLGVSRYTVYLWIAGQHTPHHRHTPVIMDILRELEVE